MERESRTTLVNSSFSIAHPKRCLRRVCQKIETKANAFRESFAALLSRRNRHTQSEPKRKAKEAEQKKKGGKENNVRTVVRNEVQLLIPATTIIGVFLSLSKALSRGKFFEFCRKRVAAWGINKREGRVGEGWRNDPCTNISLSST